jgi:hypothetical protein
LEAPRDDGSTLREHLAAIVAQGGQVPEEYASDPELPSLARHVWQWFGELHAARDWSGFAPRAVSYAELVAWSALSGNRLAAWEVAALRALDVSWLNGYAKRTSSNQRR